MVPMVIVLGNHHRYCRNINLLGVIEKAIQLMILRRIQCTWITHTHTQMESWQQEISFDYKKLYHPPYGTHTQRWNLGGKTSFDYKKLYNPSYGTHTPRLNLGGKKFRLTTKKTLRSPLRSHTSQEITKFDVFAEPV